MKSFIGWFLMAIGAIGIYEGLAKADSSTIGVLIFGALLVGGFDIVLKETSREQAEKVRKDIEKILDDELVTVRLKNEMAKISAR